jgi:hypothetical protein
VKPGAGHSAWNDLNRYIELAQKRLEEHYAFGTLTIPLVLLSCAVLSLAITHVMPLIQRIISRKNIEIIFPNECNLEHKFGHPFKRSSTPLISGQPRPTTKSLHQFFIGVRNPSEQKTLRNVRVLAECHTYGSFFSEYLLCERTKSQSADISPHMIDYLMLGQGIDSSDVGLFSPQINPPPSYMDFFAQMEAKPHVGFVIFGDQKYPTLLKNNGLELKISVFADDTPSESSDFVLDLRDRIRLTRKKRQLFRA